MTNLDIMTEGVEFTSRKIKLNRPGCSQTDANRYSVQCMNAVLFRPPQEWASSFTRQNNLRNNMLSLSKDSIKNELLKHAVNVTAYNRSINNSEASYLGTEIDINSMTDNRIATAISNSVEFGDIERLYSLLDNPDVMSSCLRSFVMTVNDPDKKESVFMMQELDPRASALTDSLDVYYARWKDTGQKSTTSDYGGK